MAVENAPAIADVLLAGGRKPGHAGRGHLPGQHAGGAHRPLDARRARRRPRCASRSPRRRSSSSATWWPSRTPTASPDALTWPSSSRSPTRPTRGWPTTATCATSSCASTSRPSTGCSSPRARRSYAARRRPASPPRSFLMAPRWLDGLGDVLGPTRRALLRAVRGPRRGGHRLPRPPWRPGLAGTSAAAARSRRSWPAPAPSWCSRTSSTTRTSAPIFRCGAAFGFDAVLLAPRCADPLYRRSIKVGMGAVFTLPWTRLPDWQDALPVAEPGRVHHRRAHAGRRSGGHRGRGRRSRQGRAGPRQRGARPVVAVGAGRRRPGGHPDVRRRRLAQRRRRRRGGLLRDGRR